MNHKTAIYEAGRLAAMLEIPVWVYNRLYWRDDPERYSFYIEPISNWDLATEEKMHDMYLVFPDTKYRDATPEECQTEFDRFRHYLDMIDARMRLVRMWRDSVQAQQAAEEEYDPTSYTWTHD